MLVFVFIYFFSTTEMPHKCTEPNLSYNKGIKARIEQKRLHQLYCIVLFYFIRGHIPANGEQNIDRQLWNYGIPRQWNLMSMETSQGSNHKIVLANKSANRTKDYNNYTVLYSVLFYSWPYSCKRAAQYRPTVMKLWHSTWNLMKMETPQEAIVRLSLLFCDWNNGFKMPHCFQGSSETSPWNKVPS